jgi:hypothetical protein
MGFIATPYCNQQVFPYAHYSGFDIKETSLGFYFKFQQNINLYLVVSLPETAGSKFLNISLSRLSTCFIKLSHGQKRQLLRTRPTSTPYEQTVVCWHAVVILQYKPCPIGQLGHLLEIANCTFRVLGSKPCVKSSVAFTGVPVVVIKRPINRQ